MVKIMSIWRELDKINKLEEHINKQLVEMAMPLALAKTKISSKSDIIIEHILKSIVYGDSLKSLNHWCKEAGSWLDLCGNIILKPKNNKPSKNQYASWIFSYWFSDKDNVRASLKFLAAECIDYPEFDVNDELINKVYDIGNQIQENILDMLTQKSLYSAKTYSQVILEILSKNGVN